MVFILDTHKVKLNITMMPNPTAFKHSSALIHRVASRSYLLAACLGEQRQIVNLSTLPRTNGAGMIWLRWLPAALPLLAAPGRRLAA
eukprot:COSAG01_NODE_16680_length_1215_cov_106.880824_3_plen_87_part_00